MKYRSFALSCVVLFFSAAALANMPGEDKVIAKVADHPITSSQIDMALAAFPPQQRALLDNAEGRKTLLQQLITFNLMAEDGKAQGLENSDDFKRALEQLKRQQLVELAVQKVMSDLNEPVTDQEAQEYYNQHKEQFKTPESIRASHILFELDKNASEQQVKETEEAAQKLIDQIKNGDISFEEAAETKSACPSKTSGGDLNYFVRGQMVPSFEKAAFALNVGEMTDKPVRTDFGFHIIKVTDHQDPKTQPFDVVKDQIKAEVDRERKLSAIENYDQSLRKKYKVEILDPTYAAGEAK